MRFIQGIFVTFVMLVSLALPARGEAVRTPATAVRQWSVTASTTAASISFTAATGTGGATRNIQSSHVRLIHDGASGDPVIYVSLQKNSADIVAPTNGSQIFTLKGAESLGFDGEFWQVRYLAASGTPAMRIIVSSPE